MPAKGCSIVLIFFAAALACAGPAGKDGTPGPAGPGGGSGAAGDGGIAGPPGPVTNTAETCSLCHGVGQLVDDISFHKAISSVAVSRNFATITSVTIPGSPPLKPTVVFTVMDAATGGAPVPGLTYFNFTVAQLVPAGPGGGGIFNWRNLLNRNYNAASDPSIGGGTESSLPVVKFPGAAVSSCTESPPPSGGTYTCVLGNDLSVVQLLNPDYAVVTNAFDPSLPTRIGLQSAAPNPGAAPTVLKFSAPPWGGSFPPPPATITVPPTPPFNATFDLDASGAPSADPKAEVTTAACNKCHQRLTAHGRRLDVNYCVTCHNAFSLDPSLPTATRDTVDFKRVLHKLHMGKNLPSVLAGGKFLFHGVDFSDVTFPQMTSNATSDTGNCTACHVLTSATASDAANNWKNKPTIVACQSCHDLTSFAATAPPGFTLHSGGPQADNNQCAVCHASGSAISPVDVRHTGLAAQQALRSGKFQYQILGVTNTAPGQFPVVTYQVVDPTNSNTPYALTEPAWAQIASGSSRLFIDLAWSTRAVTAPGDTNYTNEGSGADPGQPVSIDALKSKVAGTAAGTFTVTSKVAVPANAVGVGEVVMEGHPADTSVTPNARLPVKNAIKTFAITGTKTDARRAVVDVDKCNACHGNLTLHGSNRTSTIEACVACHNTNATDISRRPKTGPTLDNKAEASVDFKRLIHGIHGAGYSGQGPVIYGFGGAANDFRAAGFPGNDGCRSDPARCLVANCEVCHNPGTYSAGFAPANGTTTSTATLTDPSSYLRTTRTTATCSACHAQPLYLDHMQQMGGHFELTQQQIDNLP